MGGLDVTQGGKVGELRRLDDSSLPFLRCWVENYEKPVESQRGSGMGVWWRDEGPSLAQRETIPVVQLTLPVLTQFRPYSLYGVRTSPFVLIVFRSFL